MSAKAMLQMYHRWNAWAYEALFDAIAVIPEEAYKSHTNLPFRSIHGTLNHLLLTERLWYQRVVGNNPVEIAKYWTIEPSYAVPGALDIHWEHYIDDRKELENAIREQAKLWSIYVENFADLGELEYVDTSGTNRRKNLHTIVLHVANHATHHRGQISSAIHRLGFPVPDMDLPYFPDV